MKIEKTRR